MTVLLVCGWGAALVALLVAAGGVQRARRVGDLAARASHEVRGPLTAAQLALDGLTVRGEVDACGTLALELQLRRARKALDDLTLCPRGRSAADRVEAVPLAALAAELDATWRPVVAARGRELVVQPAPAPAGVVIADRVRLAQAVGNLVANALEHGTGPVRIGVATAPGGRRARVTVADAGPGPAGRLSDRRTPRRNPMAGPLPQHGHGLGVAADVARRAGGRLVAAGAELSLELPLADVDVAA